MDRKGQYHAFLPFFEAEEARYAALTQRATVFLGLSSIISLFGGLKLTAAPIGMWQHALLLATAGLVLLAVLCALASLWIRSYRVIADVPTLVIAIDEEGYDEEDIYSVLLANMADAIGHNRRVNNSRGKWLEYSATFFALAVVAVALTSVLTVR